MATNATAKKKHRFLDALRERGTVYHAAKQAKIDRRTVYRWREDEGFAQTWDEVLDECVEAMEASFYERGLAGDNTAGIFWLKAHRPQKYSDRLRLEVTVEQVVAEARRIAGEVGLSQEDTEQAVAEAERLATGA